MVQAATDIAEYFNTPEGTPTVCELMEKNEDNQFELEISEKT